MENNFNSCNIPRILKKIQSIGYVFILDGNTLTIKGFSKNIPTALALSEDQLYQNNFTDLLHEDYRDVIYNYLLYKANKKTVRIIMLVNNKSYYAHIYKTFSFVIIEMEEKTDYISLPLKEINILHNDITSSYYSKEMIVNIIKKLTNFKRILLYEFTPDWDGYVSVEKSEYPKPNFKDVYFYNTDIPVYVRGLFCTNPIRYIYNRDDVGIDIDWYDSSIQEKVDAKMSEIILTNVSHKEYLKVMNVVSSFSLSILVNNKLWGLVICHNDTPLYINPLIRQQCRIFVELFAKNLEAKNKSDENTFNEYIYKLYQFISIYNFISTEELYDMYNLVLDKLKKLTVCDDIIGNLEHNPLIFNKEHDLNDIISTNLDKFSEIFHTENAQKDLKTLLDHDISPFMCRCLIIIKLNKKEWIGFVKKGLEIVTKWAGNSIVRHKKDIILPRKSFKFIKKTHISFTPFFLSYKNIQYMRQILLFIISRLGGKDYLMEYFITHSKTIKQELISNILHEIRNPLNAIAGLFHVIEMNDNVDKEMIKDGINMVKSITDLTTNLIEVEKYRLNDNLKLTPVHWETLILKCIKMYKYMVIPGVKIKYVIPEDLPELLSDDVKIFQILTNLLSNAVKNTENGEIVILITILNKVEKTWWVKISIKDTGKGISLLDQIKLFKIFDKPNDNFIHVNGLGLILCSKVASVLNGYIKFQSEEDSGSTFDLVIPCNLPPKHVKNNSEIPKSRSKKILIAEDNVLNRRVLEFKLKNCNIVSVENGKEAINMVEKQEFDVILMDLQMPVMNGVDATCIIRKKYNFKNKIIAVTGHEFDQDYFISKGFDDFIIKPVDFEKLDSLIN